MLVRYLDVYASASATAIDGEKIDTLTVPIQSMSAGEYNAALAAAPVIAVAGYSFARMLYRGNTFATPGNAYGAYVPVMNPALWCGVAASTRGKTAQLQNMLENEPSVLYLEWQPGMFIHLTNGTNIGYCAKMNDSGSGDWTTIFTNIRRVDYTTGAANTTTGLVSGLFCGFTYNRTYGGHDGNLNDFFSDGTSLSRGNIRMGSNANHGNGVFWGGTARTPYYASTVPVTDIHAAWILGARGEDTPLYLYLYGDDTGKIYSFQEGMQFEVADGLCAQSFGSYGMLAPPPGEVLSALTKPRVYRWTALMPTALPLTATVTAVPKENVIESECDLSDASRLIADLVEYSGNVAISYSYDGNTWTEPAAVASFLATPVADLWAGIGSAKRIWFRVYLESSDAVFRKLSIKYKTARG